MSLDYLGESLDVKNTGRTTYVPDNNLAKLMYYLDCATTVIQYDLEGRLTDYKNYDRLRAEEEELVVDLVKIVEPDFLIKHYLFLVGEKYIGYYPSDNKFLEITNNIFGLHIDSEIMVAGVARRVNKIMVCRECWLKEYYYDPMDYYNRKKKTCCDKFCKFLDCFAGCFDTCCSCCDRDHCCSNCCKKVCCLIIWGFIIFNIVMVIISNV